MESMVQNRYEILWRPLKNGAQILRVYGNQLEVVLPPVLEGYPVTEIGAYCFSASERLPEEDYYITAVTQGQEERVQMPTLPSISGSYVERIVLPDTVTTFHNAAFYNCRKLKELSVGKNIQAIGSDVFMNCLKLTQIQIRCDVEEQTGLFLILERLTTDVEVRFCGKDAYDYKHMVDNLENEKAEAQTVLFFPEYYEWLDEITPAHIFSRSIEGEGYRMRHIFDGRNLNLHKYDQCFPGVLIGETDQSICQIAMDRLRWPTDLKEEEKVLYDQAVEERFDKAITMIIQGRELDGLTFLCEHFSVGQGQLSAWMEECIAADWGEGSAYLLEEKHKSSSFAKKEFTFDDFDDFDDF